jgi:hypothetical protein
LAAHRRDRPSLCSNRRYSYSQQPTGNSVSTVAQRMPCSLQHAARLEQCGRRRAGFGGHAMLADPARSRLRRCRVEPHSLLLCVV